MNILLQNGCPHDIDGAPIYASFRNMIQFENLIRDENVPSELKISIALKLLFKEPQSDIEKAFNGLLWFYGCGVDAEEVTGTGATSPIAYSFEQDADLIYAAFYAAYGINLATVRFMHWWEFSALLKGLSDDTKFMRVVDFRTADVSKMGKEQRAYYLEMRDKYAIKKTGSVKALTLAQRDEMTKNCIAERFRKAEQATKG